MYRYLSTLEEMRAVQLGTCSDKLSELAVRSFLGRECAGGRLQGMREGRREEITLYELLGCRQVLRVRCVDLVVRI